MTIITLPTTLTKDRQLVAVPRSAYEEFLAWQKSMKSKKTFKPTAMEKRALARARKNFSQKNYITLEQLEHELGIAH